MTAADPFAGLDLDPIVSSDAVGDDPFAHLDLREQAAPMSWHMPTGDEARAFGYGAADAASLGFGDEGAGAIAGIGAVLGGGDYALAYRQRVDAARARLEEARRLHPISTMAGTFAGAAATMVVPGAGEFAASRLGLQGAARAANLARGVMAGERLVPFGSTLGRMASGGGGGAVLAQGIRGLETGAMFGGVYGAGAANEGNRLEGAIGGAILGGGLGAVSPIAFQGLAHGGQWYSPAIRSATGAAIGGASSMFTGADPGQSAMIGAGVGLGGRPVLAAVGGPILAGIRRAWRNPTEAFGPGRANSVIPGAPPIPGGGEPAAAGAGAPPPDRNAVRRMTDALHRQRTSVDELDALRTSSVADNAADVAAGRAPVVRRIADTGPELSAEVDTIANLPGESLTRVTEIQRELASAFPTQLRAEMRGILGVRETPGELIDKLRAAAQGASDGYERVTAQAPLADIVQRRIVPLMETPEMQPVLARRFRVEEGQSQLSRVNGGMAPARSVERTPEGYRLSPEVNGRQLHDLKVNIDDELKAATDHRSLSPAGRSEQNLLDDYRNTYIRALDDALPGYQAVRSQRGSTYDAERALHLDRDGNSTVGQRILRMDPEEITRFMRETTTPTGRRRFTTPFERRAYRSGVVQEILQKVDDYVSAASDKTRNAGEVLDRVGLQNRLRAVFSDRPREIDQFLDRAIERAENLRRASSWTGNSRTARRLSRGADHLADSMAHAGAHLAAGGNIVGAAGALGKGAYSALVLRNLENQNNAFGHALLRPLDDEPETIALLNAIRKLQADRAERARQAGIGGMQGSIGFSGHEDQGY